jgi:hypothetical protein
LRGCLSRAPRSGEFFAPLPLAALALTVANDLWLKPALHDGLTGKLSDVGVCLFMPLFVSELLGLCFGVRPRARLWAGALVTGILYTLQEVVPPFIRLALAVLRTIGPWLGIHRRFQLTSDWTDLFCLLLIPVAAAYGSRRLRRPAVGLAAKPGTIATGAREVARVGTPRSAWTGCQARPVGLRKGTTGSTSP